MALLIPIGNIGTGEGQAPVREQVTTLAGVQRKLRFTWKERPGGGALYIDVENLDGTIVAKNRRMSPEMYVVWDLGQGTNTGSLYVTGPEPYYQEQVGQEVQLWFLAPGETITQAEEDPNLKLITTVL